jgi:hypothetical protein
MKYFYTKFLVFFLLVALFSACAGSDDAFGYSAPTATVENYLPMVSKPSESPIYWQPQPGTSWQIQYTGDLDLTVDAQIYNLDLFETSRDTIDLLHAQNRKVMCYFSAGSYEDWRPDADQFPESVLGNDMENWEGEKWLDIRQIDVLEPIMGNRMNLAVEKGCDGVDPDNVHGYENNTGFPLTYEDQINYNIWLAGAAHARGLAIGLKNDILQIADLVSYFDWELNEECFQYNECEYLTPFIDAGKPVFGIEYIGSPDDFCPEANQANFDWLKKNLELDAWRVSCR